MTVLTLTVLMLDILTVHRFELISTGTCYIGFPFTWSVSQSILRFKQNLLSLSDIRLGFFTFTILSFVGKYNIVYHYYFFNDKL